MGIKRTQAAGAVLKRRTMKLATAKLHMMAISNVIASGLAHAFGEDMRYALVVWNKNDKEPCFSTSNEYDLPIAQNMLVASARLIDEGEIIVPDDVVGHA